MTEYRLAYGRGRSYGDCCLNNGHTQCPTKFLDMLIEFDSEKGLLRAEAGCTLGEVLDVIVPRGWFVPVSPGTRHITLGGAVANDVHGKNHSEQGCFGRHVEELRLWRTTGETIACGPVSQSEWFESTVGGLGLTGLVTELTLRLKKINSGQMTVSCTPFASLDDFFLINEQSVAKSEYTVGWVDSMSREGRGLYMRGEHSPSGMGDDPSPHRQISMPPVPAGFLMSRTSIQIFNYLYYRTKSRKSCFTQGLRDFFYPLDLLNNWNKLYGRAGFQQYQCVLPMEVSRPACKEIIRHIASSRQGNFLSVIKTFGSLPSPGILSFPRPGVTLAVDFANTGSSLEKLFQYLDSIVRNAGGRLYPAKDARMSREDFQKHYPKWQEVERMRDPGISSSFWRRVTDG